MFISDTVFLTVSFYKSGYDTKAQTMSAKGSFWIPDSRCIDLIKRFPDSTLVFFSNWYAVIVDFNDIAVHLFIFLCQNKNVFTLL